MQIRAFWLHIFSSKSFTEQSYSMNDFSVKSIFLDSKGLYFLDRKICICSSGRKRLFMNPKMSNNMRKIFKRLLVFGSSKPKTIIWSNFFLLIIFSELTENDAAMHLVFRRPLFLMFFYVLCKQGAKFVLIW